MNVEIIKFALIGGGATLTHLIAATVLLALFKTTPAVAINTAAFCVAFAISYFGHRYFTFKTNGSALRFFVTALIGLAINNLIVTLTQVYMASRFVPILMGTITAPIAVFILSKYWVFKKS